MEIPRKICRFTNGKFSLFLSWEGAKTENGALTVVRMGIFGRKSAMQHAFRRTIIPFFKNVFLRIIGPLATMVVVCYSSAILIDIPYRLIITFSCSLVVGVLSIWGFTLNIEEKQYVKNIIKKLKK